MGLLVFAADGTWPRASWRSYELNLVLDDGSRVPVVEYSDRSELSADVERLSALIDKPVWDATRAGK